MEKGSGERGREGEGERGREGKSMFHLSIRSGDRKQKRVKTSAWALITRGTAIYCRATT